MSCAEELHSRSSLPPLRVAAATALAARVRLYRGGDKVAEQELREGQEFTFLVKQGTYSLATSLGDFDCTQEVSVQHPRVKADLLCPIK